MNTKLFAERLVLRLRKRAGEYNDMANRHYNYENKVGQDEIEERAVARSLNETADCVEETICSFDEE